MLLHFLLIVLDDHLGPAVSFSHVESHVAGLCELRATNLTLEGSDSFVRHDVVSGVAALHELSATLFARQLAVDSACLLVINYRLCKVFFDQLIHLLLI